MTTFSFCFSHEAEYSEGVESTMVPRVPKINVGQSLWCIKSHMATRVSCC
jgi:hypothetical protein